MAKKERLYENNLAMNVFFDLYFALLLGSCAYLHHTQKRLHWMFSGWAFVVLFIVATQYLSGTLGPIFSRTFLSGPAFDDPLRKAKTLSKFNAQWWQLTVHVLLTLATLKTVGSEEWFMVPEKLLSPEAMSPGATSEALDMLYSLELSVWIVTLFSHRFYEERHKDYYVMTAHHVCTISLVLMSFIYQEQRIGVCIMYLHDISDIPIDFLKITNLLKLDGAPGLFMSETSYAVNLVSWVYHRLYLYPHVIIWKAILMSGCTLGGFSGPLHGLFVGTHYPYTDPPQVNLQGACGPDRVDGSECTATGEFTYNFGCPVGIPFVVSLLLMHIWWTYLLLRIGYKTIFGGMKGHAAGAENYEGHSSDDDKDN